MCVVAKKGKDTLTGCGDTNPGAHPVQSLSHPRIHIQHKRITTLPPYNDVLIVNIVQVPFVDTTPVIVDFILVL